MATNPIDIALRFTCGLTIALTLTLTPVSSFLGHACAAEPDTRDDDPMVQNGLMPQDELGTQYELSMMTRPELPKLTTHRKFADGLLALWLKALDRPDAELRRMTIDTIAIAHRRGVPGIDQAEQRLIELASLPDLDPDVALSAAHALVEFDVKEASPVLAEMVTRHGDRAAEIIEPAIAKWKSKIMLDRWSKRVEDNDASETMMLLAIDGLAEVKANQANEALYKLVQNPNASFAIRLRAASAMGTIGTTDAADRADELLAAVPSEASSVVSPLLAVAILGSDNSARTSELLVRIAKHSNSLVQSASLQRLYEIDPAQVDHVADSLIASDDVNVRRNCVRGMLHKPNSKRVRAIAPLLNDINPTLRRQVAAGLFDWASDPEIRGDVIAQTMLVLHEDSWQGCEQAIVLLTKLEHKPAGSRFVDLLGHFRSEVKIAAAWALGQFRDKTHLPDMLTHAENVYQRVKSGQANDDPQGSVLQMAHLFIAFGDQMYAPAEDLMQAYLPKDPSLGFESRAAACWAIGLLLADAPPPDLVKLLTERFRDVEGMEPEDELFRSMCAIGFGRMNQKKSLMLLREFADGLSRTNMACQWSIQQMTGEQPPPVPVRYQIDNDWFLAPIVDQPN